MNAWDAATAPGPMDFEWPGPWRMRATGARHWLAATVPGTVHTDLLAAGRIPDPFWRTNERAVQWVDKLDWEYCTDLQLDAHVLAHERIDLLFEGLDTYAEVSLNGVLLLAADNMFRRWPVPIKTHLRTGHNTLRVLLKSPVQAGLARLAALGFNPPAVVDWSEVGGLGERKISMFTRKAPYHYGWDWGPRLVTSGIWRPVRVQAWSGIRIEALRVMVESLKSEEATVAIELELVTSIAGAAELTLTSPTDAHINASVRVELRAGEQLCTVRCHIRQPRLWWSNGLGEPFMYEFNAEVRFGSWRDLRSVRAGLRSLRILQPPDAEGTGFQVELNGVPIFIKGANYIPCDSFASRVSHATRAHIVQSAAAAHMNMLRIWGGGIYEQDDFYDLCDAQGILVWQDFMFACAMYPGDDAFLRNVRAEAIDNVKRLRNHPCLALWAGNNEIDVAWRHAVPGGGWGWKERYDAEQRETLWRAYRTIFHDILPTVIAEHDPGRFYWPSSPLAAWDGADGLTHADLSAPRQSGDIHYWGVWWGKQPFSTYRRAIGRFMSEYGFQSFPSLPSVRAFTAPEDLSVFSEVMRAHQRSAIGNETILEYMARDYPQPRSFPAFLYVSQVLQAEGVRVAMEAHRVRRPYCMGSLYWQINDCWPAASWSSIDVYGRWKALHYFARRAFAPMLLSAWLEDDLIMMHAVNDTLAAAEGTLTLRLTDFRGTVLRTHMQPVHLAANSSTRIGSYPASAWLAGTAADAVLLQCTVQCRDGRCAEQILYFRPVKDLALPAAAVEVNVAAQPTRLALTVRCPVLVKTLCLETDTIDGHFSDNHFELLPGKSRTVYFTPAGQADVADLERDLQLWHMARVMA
ncbi:MAG: beta-mannosidase [Steroidobacteraceae bacterium]